MIRRNFFKKFSAALGVTLFAPLAFSKTSKAHSKDSILVVVPKSTDNGGLGDEEKIAINNLNLEFRKSGKLLSIVRKTTDPKATDMAVRVVYRFDSKQSKAQYISRKEELLKQLSNKTASV